MPRSCGEVAAAIDYYRGGNELIRFPSRQAACMMQKIGNTWKRGCQLGQANSETSAAMHVRPGRTLRRDRKVTRHSFSSHTRDDCTFSGFPTSRRVRDQGYSKRICHRRPWLLPRTEGTFSQGANKILERLARCCTLTRHRGQTNQSCDVPSSCEQA